MGSPSTPSGSSDGGGDGNRPAVNRGPDLPVTNTAEDTEWTIRGRWTGHIGDLGERAERTMREKPHDAVTAGLLADCAVDRVRSVSVSGRQTIQDACPNDRRDGQRAGGSRSSSDHGATGVESIPTVPDIKRTIQQLTDLGLRLTAEERFVCLTTDCGQLTMRSNWKDPEGHSCRTRKPR